MVNRSCLLLDLILALALPFVGVVSEQGSGPQKGGSGERKMQTSSPATSCSTLPTGTTVATAAVSDTAEHELLGAQASAQA